MDDERGAGDSMGKGTKPEAKALDRVELPKSASAYYSPKPPPATTQHRTMEVEAVRVDPALEFDVEDTVRMQVAELPSPSVDRNARTQLLPVVRRRRRIRWILPIAALLLVAIAFAIAHWMLRNRGRSSVPGEQSSLPATQQMEPSERELVAASPEGSPVRDSETASRVSHEVRGASRESGKEHPAARKRSRDTSNSRPSASVSVTPAFEEAVASEVPEPNVRIEPSASDRSTTSAQSSPSASSRSWIQAESPKAWLK